MFIKRVLTATLLLIGLTACDPEGRNDCVWTLEPEPKNISQVTEGLVPLCARNRVTMKQDCRLQAPLDFAKDAYGKKFRYSDMVVKSFGIPRTIATIRFCE